METYCVSCKKNILQTKIQVSEKLNKIDECSYHIVLFVARENQLTVCSYYVTYTFQSESTLYICLNVKELLAQNR